MVVARALLLSAALLVGCGWNAPEEPVLTVYSGRTEALIEPLVESFRQSSGLTVRVKYADSAQLASTLLAEGARSPADVFIAQDASTLAYLEQQGVFARLPDRITWLVEPRFRSGSGAWVGISGRARVLAYHPDRLPVDELPRSVHDLTDPRFRGRLGWAPENASFQSFVAGMIQLEGEEATERWLRAMRENEPREYPKNAPAVLAVARGEIDAALTNHYYTHRLADEQGAGFPVRNHYFPAGDAAAMINLSGVAVLQSASQPETALQLVEHLLQAPAQEHFAVTNHEIPLASGVPTPEGLPSLDDLATPEVDLAELRNLEQTVKLLRTTGVLR